MIRHAIIEDAPQLVSLCTQLGYDISLPTVEATIGRISHEPGSVILVITSSGRVTGWVHVFLTERVESGLFAEIGGLVVDEQVRRQGVGELLMKSAVQWAKHQGVAKIRVRCADKRTDAHTFYKNLGMSWSKSQHVFDLKLSNQLAVK